MATNFQCNVNAVGPASDATDTAPPVIYIMLTDTQGSFGPSWFFAPDNSKQQMLAVALTAMSLQATVSTWMDPPNPNNTPITPVLRMSMNAS